MLKKIYNWSGSWTGTIIIVLVVMSFVAQAFVIPSGSMKNTLLIGDMLFVKKFSYGIPIPRIPWLEIKLLPDFNDNGHLIEGDKPKRGEIVVFRYPADEKIHFVKRCVGVGGDLIAIQNKQLLLHPHEGNDYVKQNYKKEQIVNIDNKLWVINPYKNKHPGIHNDENVQNNGLYHQELFNIAPIQVPQGEYFMMGDNRDHSNDSRFWGTVPYKYIVGTPWIIYFSWNEDKQIRWNRVFRTPTSIEADMYGKIINTNHKEGIY